MYAGFKARSRYGDGAKQMKKKYTYWHVEEMWLGYLEEYPDYWT
jgi:hypothetical protein